MLAFDLKIFHALYMLTISMFYACNIFIYSSFSLIIYSKINKYILQINYQKRKINKVGLDITYTFSSRYCYISSQAIPISFHHLDAAIYEVNLWDLHFKKLVDSER